MITNQAVVYRHSFDGMSLSNAQVRIKLKSQLGELIVEAGTDGQNWQEAGRFATPVAGALAITNIPAALLPAGTVFVRLRANGTFWVSGYRFESDILNPTVSGSGNQWFFEQENPNSSVVPVSISPSVNGNMLTLELRNASSSTQELAVESVVQGSEGTRSQTIPISVPALTTNLFAFELASAGEGENSVVIEVKDLLQNTTLLKGGLKLTISRFVDNSFGELLSGPTENPVWWCPGLRKVFRERFLPVATNSAAAVFAARNEYEPFQLVLRPESNLSNVMVSVGDFVFQGGGGVPPIRSTNVEVCLAEYVPITEIYDAFGAVGNYPDPLVPLTSPFQVSAHTNQPIWFTVYVPKDAPAGTYLAPVTITSTSTTNSVAVRLQVFDFTLSDVTHNKAAMGVHVDTYWHGSPNTAQRRAIYDLYMQNFARHRLSPYMRETDFGPLWPSWSLNNGQFTHNFTDFDATMGRWLDELNFNNFKLLHEPVSLGGMPGSPRSITNYLQN